MFECIFLKEEKYILIPIMLNFALQHLVVHKLVLLQVKSVLVQIMAWCWTCDKPLPELMMPNFHNFPRNWPFVRGIHRSPVNSPHKGQWRGALMFSLICVWINNWVNNREAGDLRCCRAHYDVIVMDITLPKQDVLGVPDFSLLWNL